MRVALILIAWGVFSYIWLHGVGYVPALYISLIPFAIGWLRWFDTKEYKEWKVKRLKGGAICQP